MWGPKLYHLDAVWISAGWVGPVQKKTLYPWRLGLLTTHVLALGLGYMVDMFKNRVENYVRNLVGDKKPKKA